MKRKTFRTTATLIILLSLLLSAAVNAAGIAVYTNTRLLADNLEYINTVSWDSEAGRTESFAVRMTGSGDAYPIVINGDTIFGGFTISEMVSYAENQGKNVLAVVNTDFFMDNTVPIGIVVEDGVFKSGSGGRNAVSFGYDGSVDIVEAATVIITLDNKGGAEGESNAGKSIEMRNFNKIRSELGGMFLYSEAFSTVSTRTSTPGWYVRFKILEGTPSVSGTMTLEVTETSTTEGAVPIGEGNMVLTAADKSDLTSEYEKFAVGDIITLTTSCADDRLVNAQYATGGGDILVSNGAITDSADWPATLMPRAPRTAFGVREDGTTICYAIDGRNSEHSVGLTLEELAGEMMQMGCVYAVNFDGGGSTALSVQIPGESSASVVNSPSDGKERRCATYILFATDAKSNGVAVNLSLQNDGVIVLAESSFELIYSATDGGYRPASVPDDITAQTKDPDAYVSGTLYTAGKTAVTDKLSLYSASTGAQGTGEVYVITRPTSITASIPGSASPLTSIKISPGATLSLDVTATYYRRAVIAQLNSFTYTVSGDIGEMVEPGVFEAGLATQQTGSITISADGRSIEILVEISGFADMENHWARDHVEYLQQAGVIKGITDTEFGPSLLMKRCDFILMLHRAAGELEPGIFVSYDDIPEDAYYTDAIAWAREMGITDDTVENLFYPQTPLTRQDAFTFTYGALGVLGKQYSDGTAADLEAFPDAGLIDDYAVIPTATLIMLGVVDGMNGSLEPQGTLTRAQMAKVLALVIFL